jgi:hypothetical protein
MSKERMNDVRDLLLAEGWLLLNPDDMYTLVNDEVTWELEHASSTMVVNLDVFASGDLGERTDSLKDLFYCVVRDRDLKLYFAKRNSEEWRRSLIEFRYALRALVSKD